MELAHDIQNMNAIELENLRFKVAMSDVSKEVRNKYYDLVEERLSLLSPIDYDVEIDLDMENF